MLIFGKHSTTKDLQNVDLKSLLNDFVDSMEVEVVSSSGSAVVVEKEWDDEELIVAIDPEKIRQVLLNLSINAVQAMGEYGELKVTCSKSEKSKGNYAIFTIEDTGDGIAQEQLESIFTPFHTTKENGTGLGLAIVKKLIDFHDGIIKVESVIGEGTTFQVFLPLV